VEQPATELAERLPAPEVTTDSAVQAYDRVLANVGATLPERDEVDTLLISHVQDQTGVLITTEADLVAEGISNEGYGTLADGTPPPDVDRDGMADAWEDENGLDSADPADGVLDADDDGYTNLEEYLNALVPEG
jgi:pectate lyase